MTFGAYYPYRHPRCLQILTDREVSKIFEEGQEAHIWAFLDAFEDKSITQILITIMYIRFRLTHQHEIDDLLARIAMFIEQRISFHIHITLNQFGPPSQNAAVNQQNNALALLAIEQAQIHFHQIENHRVIIAVRKHDFAALMWLDGRIFVCDCSLWNHQVYICLAVIAGII